MDQFKYPRLFTPIKLGNTWFRNRIFASPTGFLDTDYSGALPPEAAFYYERKAMGGAASIAVGECVISKNVSGASRHISLDDPMQRNGLARVADAVRRQGAVCAAELTHAGMYAGRMAQTLEDGYGPVDTEDNGRIIHAMNEEQIEEVIKMYANAARCVKACGFGMAIVHAGHGWLLHQFLSPFINTRTDRWGGSDENRARLLVEVLKAMRKEVGPGFPIEVRISGSECYDGGFGIETGIAAAKAMDGYCDLIHVSAGSHEVEQVFTVTHPSMFLSDGCNVKYAAEIKKHVKTPVATVGALVEPELMEEILASGKADVVEIARGLMADPDIPLKARSGREDEIRKCMRCLACFSNLLNEGQFKCAINPEIGHEAEYRFELPPAHKKKVLVAGGGIAGMEAAIDSAKRGHSVILCEKSGRLGGTLLCEHEVPFKARLREYIEYQEKQLEKNGVEVRLNTPATTELAAELKPDVIVAAFGARPVKPNIPGIDGKNVFSAEEVYVEPDKAGKNVVILGAGLVGVELGIYLGMLGRKVTVVEMLDGINHGGNNLHVRALNVEIDKYGIDMHFNTKALEITESGVRCQGPDGEEIFSGDTVIYAVGQRPLYEEAAELRCSAPEFYQLGDCIGPRNIMSATAAAFSIARNIGRI
ncbi:MAG: FAD-dependent oxidoreductase [Oscillospiraceae bacterium]|nr:FAD-dependent oxidoreductase [Oscillospiraceae bacterium]